ncbi:MAG: hypothetical protein ACRCTY_05545 [Candidatus Adiutrix sp.]
MPIKIALVISAPIELTLNAGREEIVPTETEEVSSPDDSPFLVVGVARADEMHLSGPLVFAPADVGATVSAGYFFPDGEGPTSVRPIDLSSATLHVHSTPRQKADRGFRWRYRLESRKPFQQTLIFEGGFMPPFKASHISLGLEHLINYNYDGYVLSSFAYNHKAPICIESDWRFPTVESEGYLVD